MFVRCRADPSAWHRGALPSMVIVRVSVFLSLYMLCSERLNFPALIYSNPRGGCLTNVYCMKAVHNICIYKAWDLQ